MGLEPLEKNAIPKSLEADKVLKPRKKVGSKLMVKPPISQPTPTGRRSKYSTCYQCFKKFPTLAELEEHKKFHEESDEEEEEDDRDLNVQMNEIEKEVVKDDLGEDYEGNHRKRKLDDVSSLDISKKNCLTPGTPQNIAKPITPQVITVVKSGVAENIPKIIYRPIYKNSEVIDNKPKTASELPAINNIALKCNTCDITLHSSNALIEHVPITDLECSFTCKVCSENYSNPVSYLGHIMQHNLFSAKTNRVEEVKPQTEVDTSHFKYKCNLCQKRFEDCFQLKRHETFIHNIKDKGKSSVPEPAKVFCVISNVISGEIDQKDDTEQSPDVLDSVTAKQTVPNKAKMAGTSRIKVSERSITNKGKGLGLDDLDNTAKSSSNASQEIPNEIIAIKTELVVEEHSSISMVCDMCFDVFTSKEDLIEHLEFHKKLDESIFTHDEEPDDSTRPKGKNNELINYNVQVIHNEIPDLSLPPSNLLNGKESKLSTFQKSAAINGLKKPKTLNDISKTILSEPQNRHGSLKDRSKVFEREILPKNENVSMKSSATDKNKKTNTTKNKHESSNLKSIKRVEDQSEESYILKMANKTNLTAEDHKRIIKIIDDRLPIIKIRDDDDQTGSKNANVHGVLNNNPDDYDSSDENESLTIDETFSGTPDTSRGKSQQSIFVKKLDVLKSPKTQRNKIKKVLNCSSCSITFRKSRTLRLHNLRKLKCSICDYSSCKLVAMRQHYLVTHEVHLCRKCPLHFETISLLEKHVNDIHVCPICKKSIVDLRAHSGVCFGPKKKKSR